MFNLYTLSSRPSGQEDTRFRGKPGIHAVATSSMLLPFTPLPTLIGVHHSRNVPVQGTTKTKCAQRGKHCGKHMQFHAFRTRRHFQIGPINTLSKYRRSVSTFRQNVYDVLSLRYDYLTQATLTSLLPSVVDSTCTQYVWRERDRRILSACRHSRI